MVQDLVLDNPINSYKDYIEDVVLKNLGYELIKWMGITPDGNDYTGVSGRNTCLTWCW